MTLVDNIDEKENKIYKGGGGVMQYDIKVRKYNTEG